jgi:hypothetical protein
MELEGPLADAESEIVQRFGSSVRCHVEGPTLVVVCQENGATVGVTVDDPLRPSFGITYPAFDDDAVSWKDLREYSARNVLLVAVLGIFGAVEKDGAVLPEFPKPGLRKRAQRLRSSD